MSGQIERMAERRDALLARVAEIDRRIVEIDLESGGLQVEIDDLRDGGHDDDEIEPIEFAMDELDDERDTLESERVDCTIELIQIENNTRELLSAWEASMRAVAP